MLGEDSTGKAHCRRWRRGPSSTIERFKIETALRGSKWNKTRAAEQLGVSYKTLLNKIRALGLRRIARRQFRVPTLTLPRVQRDNPARPALEVHAAKIQRRSIKPAQLPDPGKRATEPGR